MAGAVDHDTTPPRSKLGTLPLRYTPMKWWTRTALPRLPPRCHRGVLLIELQARNGLPGAIRTRDLMLPKHPCWPSYTTERKWSVWRDVRPRSHRPQRCALTATLQTEMVRDQRIELCLDLNVDQVSSPDESSRAARLGLAPRTLVLTARRSALELAGNEMAVKLGLAPRQAE